MGKRQEGTPRSQVRSALRRVWMRSRERRAALKRAGDCCEECGKKGKVDVHHREGITWERIFEYIYRHLLVHPDALEVLCSTCHEEKHHD